uniref:ATP synthase subunit a n=1 Tax=Loxosceles similis TaxID=321804 RepID=A0A4P8VWS1_LOXSM|nr:ATP synthase F0 subunit 6 [Loxosceles similis]QCS26172.1 ATP synthase F0 subunit 6 [Loxosceles similis]
MMVSLFSVFDPVVMGFSFNWLVIILCFYIIKPFYFKMMSYNHTMFCMWMMFFYTYLSGVAGQFNKGIVVMGLGMFMYISMMNIMGLFPFIFSGTAHPIITLSLGMMLWLSCFLMGWINVKNSAAHLTPHGSPLILAPLLVLIESVSHLIRPVTLSIRLAANMMAGHLIVGLISSLSMMFAVMCQSLLLMLELGVCIIQGMVFSILFLLYAVEYY